MTVDIYLNIWSMLCYIIITRLHYIHSKFIIESLQQCIVRIDVTLKSGISFPSEPTDDSSQAELTNAIIAIIDKLCSYRC